MLLLISCHLNILAQGKIITGVILDKTGETVIGASVLVKGTTNGTITDVDGNFTLNNVQENAVLQVSFVGYKTQDIALKGHLLSGVPEKYKADWKGCQFRFCLPENAGTQKLPEAKLGIWQRDTKGGLPLETADAKIFPFLIKNRLLCLTYGADNKIDSNWKSEDYRHTILSRQEDGNYFTQFSILFPPYG